MLTDSTQEHEQRKISSRSKALEQELTGNLQSNVQGEKGTLYDDFT